jgi:hypothetical protein
MGDRADIDDLGAFAHGEQVIHQEVRQKEVTQVVCPCLHLEAIRRRLVRAGKCSRVGIHGKFEKKGKKYKKKKDLTLIYK